MRLEKMRIDKKGALELSTNFFVGLILGILMLTFGFVFLYNLVSAADKIKEQGLPDTFEMLAQSCVEKQQMLCVPMSKLTAKPGKTVSYGIVINNVLGDKKSFKPLVKFSLAVLDDGTKLTSLPGSEKWTFQDFRVMQVENNKHESFEVPIKVPLGTKRGTYVFNVNICVNSGGAPDASKCTVSGYPNLYDATHQVTVEVN